MAESLGDRMKSNYENRFQFHLIRRLPVIIRIDGHSFHSLTRHCEKPFDKHLSDCMAGTAMFLCQEIQGGKCAYIQSDEISLLLTDYNLITTQAWFDYDLQKIVSISASLATTKFTELFGKTANFDSRAFNLPIDEVCNYFIWRQKDWKRNSIAMLSRYHFPAKQLHGKNQADMLEMLDQIGNGWAKQESRWRNGLFVSKGERGWQIADAPIFTENRQSIEALLQRQD